MQSVFFKRRSLEIYFIFNSFCILLRLHGNATFASLTCFVVMIYPHDKCKAAAFSLHPTSCRPRQLWCHNVICTLNGFAFIFTLASLTEELVLASSVWPLCFWCCPRLWWRLWIICCSHEPRRRGGSCPPASSCTRPLCSSTPWRPGRLCWLTTSSRLTLCRRLLTTSVSTSFLFFILVPSPSSKLSWTLKTVKEPVEMPSSKALNLHLLRWSCTLAHCWRMWLHRFCLRCWIVRVRSLWQKLFYILLNLM